MIRRKRKKSDTDPDSLPAHLEHLYDPEEVFKIDATPEQVAEAIFDDPSDEGKG